MHSAFELTPRQSARLVEQALRARAALEIEPRTALDGHVIHGTLDGREGNLLSVRLAPAEGDGLPTGLVGVFCDVHMVQSEQLYCFSTCVLDVSDTGSPVYLLLATPEFVQVSNRRRFERHSVPVAAQVRIAPQSPSPTYVALLADVSVVGLACSLPNPTDDQALLIGDPVRLNFELPGLDRSFDLPAIVCNKSVTADKQLLTLGLEFAVPPGERDARETYERLKAAIYSMTAEAARTDERP